MKGRRRPFVRSALLGAFAPRSLFLGGPMFVYCRAKPAAKPRKEGDATYTCLLRSEANFLPRLFLPHRRLLKSAMPDGAKKKEEKGGGAGRRREVVVVPFPLGPICCGWRGRHPPSVVVV